MYVGDNLVKEQVKIEPVTAFTLTYRAGIGGTLTGETTQTVEQGTDGTPVTAAPNSGYTFTQWGDGKTDNPRIDKKVMGNISVTAEFAKKEDLTPVESVLLSNVQAQPDPFEGTLELSGVENAVRVEVYSPLGQLVYSQSLAGAPTLYFETADWQSGLYFVKLTDSEGESRVIRVVKR